MDADRLELLTKLDVLRETTRTVRVEFPKHYEQDVEAYRLRITEGIREILAELRQHTSEISAGNPLCEQLAEHACEYVDWLQWCLWDLPYFAVALRPSPEQFSRAVAACGLVYLSARVFDDVIDRHFWYKGKHPSLLSAAAEASPSSEGAEGLTILAGLLILTEGLARLADPAEQGLDGMIQPILTSIRHAVIGLVMEQSGPEHWDRAYYDRLVQLKNVDYWRCLYTAIDPGRASPLYPFLVRYYTLAQYLNDVQDFGEDQARGQPNLLSLYLSEHEEGTAPRGWCPDSPAPAAPPEVEELLIRTFVELGAMAEELPLPERLVAQLKLGESLEEAYRFGLFAAPTVPPRQGDDETGMAPLGLHWFSDIQEVIERAGSEALVKADCAVCGSSDRNFIFRKQGFAFHRCGECSHIYVSPHIHAELQAQIADEADQPGAEDTYLEAQKMYAAVICQLLRARAPGNRLLDIGFGHGHLMEMARAFGFDIFGIESSQIQMDRLRQRFGRRIYQAALGQDEIPWNSFDVVVVSHVLEHLPDPQAGLQQMRGVMNPRALLYVAVPDMRSLPFKVFGKRWDVISPLTHLQYFNEDSLSRLLRDCGFVGLERVQPPPLLPAVASRWMRLMRRLSGTDLSELIILAQVPED